MTKGALFDRDFCEPLALLAAGSACAAVGPAAVAGFALFGAPAIALGAWSGSKWLQRLKDRSPDKHKAVAKIQGNLVEQLRGEGVLESIKPELRARLDRELPKLIAAHWPPPQTLVKLAGQGFPAAVAGYVLDEIDGSAFADPLYEATSVRRFTRRVIEAALRAALSDKDYFATLDPHIAMETLGLAGAIKRDMDAFVTTLETVENILADAAPAILDSLDALHVKSDRMEGKLDLLVAKVIGDASPNAEEAEQTEQSVADLLASDLRASQDAAETLLDQGVAAATARLKQGLAEQSDAREEATRNEIALLSQIATLNYFENGEEAAAAMRRVAELDVEDEDNWNRLGILCERLGDLDGALAAYGQVHRIANDQDDDSLLAVALGNMGNVAWIRGELDRAISFYERALALNEELGREEGMANQFGNMGNVARVRGDLDGAMSFYKQSLALNGALGRKEGMASNYGSMGNVAQTRGDLNEAMVFYEQSLALNEALARKEGMASDYGNMGIVARIRGDLDEAMGFHERALALNEELGRREGIAKQYGNIGIVVWLRDDPDGAMSFHERALTLNEELGRKEGMAINYCNMGRIEERRGRKVAARDLWERALAIFKAMGSAHAATVQQWLDELDS